MLLLGCCMLEEITPSFASISTTHMPVVVDMHVAVSAQHGTTRGNVCAVLNLA